MAGDQSVQGYPHKPRGQRLGSHQLDFQFKNPEQRSERKMAFQGNVFQPKTVLPLCRNDPASTSQGDPAPGRDQALGQAAPRCHLLALAQDALSPSQATRPSLAAQGHVCAVGGQGTVAKGLLFQRMV